MHDFVGITSLCVALIWVVTLCLPWLPWAVREVLEADKDFSSTGDISDITVVIPARNEQQVIAATLKGLTQQGAGLNIILVDDESDDATVATASALKFSNLQILSSKPLPPGWTGKLWAQHQGLQAVTTANTLLLDADIKLLPGIVQSLKSKQQSENLDFISLMAELRYTSFWEKLLMPAFIYFFKMLYPFSLANQAGHKMAAAAGGCILVKTACLHEIEAMSSIRDAVIDDCTLAKKIKSAGFKTWVGLTHSVISQRPYVSLGEIWDMVARTAFSQLFYSFGLLLVCTFLMVMMYLWPVFLIFFATGVTQLSGFLSLSIMIFVYLPTLRFYSLNQLWALTMPVIAGLYLLMTWTSALRFWKGERSRWKGRIYEQG